MSLQTGDTIDPANFRGMVFPYAGSAAPTGFLLCDGSAVSRTTYAALFAVIGTTYGAGNGTTTFNVPDIRGRVIVGVGTGTRVATFASRSGDTITVTGLTSAANNEFQTGQAITYASSGTDIGGLSAGTYYVIRISNTSFKLASSLANAQNGTAVTLSSDGTGTRTFTLTLTARTLGDFGGEENHAMSSTELLAHVHRPQTYDTGAGGTRNIAQNSSSATGPNNVLLDTSSTGGNAAMNTMQPFAVLNFIIKT